MGSPMVLYWERQLAGWVQQDPQGLGEDGVLYGGRGSPELPYRVWKETGQGCWDSGRGRLMGLPGLGAAEAGKLEK